MCGLPLHGLKVIEDKIGKQHASLYRLRPEIGVARTDMVVLGDMAEGGESVRQKNLARAYQLGKEFC